MYRNLSLLILLGALVQPSWADECRYVNIMKKFVQVPASCAFDACETWRSEAVLGPGTWDLEVSFANFQFVPLQPFAETTTFVGTATDTFTHKHGDVMYAMNVVVGDFDTPLGSGIMYVNGGTGRFANASGKLFIRVDNANGRARVNGELCGISGISVLD